MTPRRLKSTVILAGLAVSGLTIIAWTGDWFQLLIDPGEGAKTTIPVSGEVAAGGLAALGLAGLALVGALSIAGPAFRVILGVLELLIGFTVTLSAVTAILDPIAAGASAVTEATGESGIESVRRLVTGTESSGWPVVAAILGVLTVVVGVVLLASGRRWPRSSSKYQTVGFEPAAGDEHGSSTSERVDPPTDSAARWDALSDGSDPTAR